MGNWIKRTTRSGNKGRSRNTYTLNQGTGKSTRSSSYGTKSYRVTNSYSSDGKQKQTITWHSPTGYTKRDTKTIYSPKKNRPKKYRPRGRRRNNSGCAILLLGFVGVYGIITTALGFIA